MSLLAIFQTRPKLAAGLLDIFLGAFDVHNFYLGYTKKAVIQLIVSLVGGIFICGIATLGIEIWAFVEGFLILTGSRTATGCLCVTSKLSLFE